jgi:hypothetical protein
MVNHVSEVWNVAIETRAMRAGTNVIQYITSVHTEHPETLNEVSIYWLLTSNSCIMLKVTLENLQKPIYNMHCWSTALTSNIHTTDVTEGSFMTKASYNQHESIALWGGGGYIWRVCCTVLWYKCRQTATYTSPHTNQIVVCHQNDRQMKGRRMET